MKIGNVILLFGSPSISSLSIYFILNLNNSTTLFIFKLVKLKITLILYEYSFSSYSIIVKLFEVKITVLSLLYNDIDCIKL